MKAKRVAIIALTILWIVTAINAIKSTTKLTYIEYLYENENAEDYIELKNNGEYLEQRFTSPYEIIYGVAINVGTFSRDNNSVWNVSLIDRQSKDVLYDKDYNASLIEENAFHLFKFDRNIKVEKDKDYIIRVQAVKVNENSSLSFYVGSGSELPGVVSGGTETLNALCFAIYGGDFDDWWMLYDIVIAIFISIAIIRVALVCSRGDRPINDKLLGGMIVALIVLVILYPFSIPEGFMDEWDNMRGGMIISRGGVLYRDYVTQHTPVMYYLCGLFALLGAGSVQQFRLSYYLFEAVVWGAIYVRHADHFGKGKMVALAVLESIFVTVMGASSGYTVLSDSMYGLCMVILLLEFLRYYDDRKLGWDRSVIVSIAIWGSIGSAFISVYSIIFIMISVIGLEIAWILKIRPGVKAVIKRYYKFVISIITPFACAIVYFKANHSLRRAFEQFYSFNRKVYPIYNSTGDNLFEPFIIAIKNFFAIIAGTIDSVLRADVTSEGILQFVIVTLATVVVIELCRKKRYVESFTLLAVMVFSGTRGNGFHGIPEWYVAVAIIALLGDGIIKSVIRKVTISVSIIIGIYLISPYVQAAGSNLIEEQQTITDFESRIVSATQENEEILIDTCCCDSLYLCYRNRYPANRATYMGLAWYMDWYEQETIDDLISKKPRIVIFNPDEGYWCNDFAHELRKDYTQFSEDSNNDWLYKVWIRTN